MKKIIDGKRYDTETAEEVATYTNNLSDNDFHYFSETLYKTKKGAWFLHGEGGAMSVWAESNGKSQWGSSDIRPLTAEEATIWLERNNFPSEEEEHFGDSIEDA